MNDALHDTAVTAAFVMEGLGKGGYLGALQAFELGAIETVSDAMEYVPAILALRAAADNVRGGPDANYPGVFEYEVSTPVGEWLGTMLTIHGKLPPKPTVVGFISVVVRTFFNRPGEPLAQISAAISKAGDVLLEADHA